MLLKKQGGVEGPVGGDTSYLHSLSFIPPPGDAVGRERGQGLSPRCFPLPPGVEGRGARVSFFYSQLRV